GLAEPGVDGGVKQGVLRCRLGHRFKIKAGGENCKGGITATVQSIETATHEIGATPQGSLGPQPRIRRPRSPVYFFSISDGSARCTLWPGGGFPSASSSVCASRHSSLGRTRPSVPTRSSPQ